MLSTSPSCSTVAESYDVPLTPFIRLLTRPHIFWCQPFLKGAVLSKSPAKPPSPHQAPTLLCRVLS